MNTATDRFAPSSWLDPLGSWEAAAHWNSMAVDWLTSGWKQWLELVTVWPALEPVATPDAPAATATQPRLAAPARTSGNARAESTGRRVARAGTHAVAKGERRSAGSKRPATKRAARPQAGSRSGSRSRG